MNSSNILHISKSSLVSLKAELIRKQEEFQKVKSLEENKFIHCLPKPVKETVYTKSNKGVEARNEKDIEQNEEDIDLLATSRKVLEAKTRLYDKLKEGTHIAEGKSKYLVDFEKKHEKEGRSNSTNVEERSSMELPDIANHSDDETRLSDTSDHPSDPEDDWVDFVDALGRTRRCLRRDLELMKSKDADLQRSIQPKPTPDPPLNAEEPQLELFSADMHKAVMRQKWEEQELKLKNKTAIHYQDILFDEARTHGVGYFNFSAEEEERLSQQESLAKMRLDTTKQQAEAKTVRDRRQQLMEARLQAARRRRRQRLGLPPEEEEEQKKDDDPVEVVECKQGDTIEDLEETLKRAAHVRPWDIGKDGIKAPEVMSQEEWVEKKRSERPEEFAPPVFEDNPIVQNVLPKRNKLNLFFTSKKSKVQNIQESETLVDNNCEDVLSGEIPTKRRGAEIPPPATMEYYGGASVSKHKPSQKQDITDSISAGLEYLRKQAEDKEKKTSRGFFEVM